MARRLNLISPPQAWTDHEHVAPPIELEARKLLQAAGALEIAKHAVEAAAGNEPSNEDKDESLAQAIGYLSYRSLVEASSKGRNVAGRQWFVTSLRPDEWVLWNDRDLEVAGIFESRKDALAGAS